MRETASKYKADCKLIIESREQDKACSLVHKTLLVEALIMLLPTTSQQATIRDQSTQLWIVRIEKDQIYIIFFITKLLFLISL